MHTGKSPRKMHADEVDTDASLVRRLLAAQFPDWAGLSIGRVPSAGTDNAIYRLGDGMAVRLPRVPTATAQVAKEHRWLPVLAPHLPLAIPVPLAEGAPGEGYPWRWAVHRWLQGRDAVSEPVTDLRQAATQLAEFITALQRIDPTGGPSAGPHNFGRGVPLAVRDNYTREAIEGIRALGTLDSGTLAAVTAAWEAALRAPAWRGAPVWIHGDMSPPNMLVQQGRLSAVIDFGCLGVGDPACELQVAWNFLSGDAREVFREALGVDDATWARGRGWALSVALVALPYYHVTNPVLAGVARRVIAEVLADQSC